MFSYELFEAPAGSVKKIVVILPGGFHPFHPGHLSLYQSAQKTFPGADIYYAATNDKSERPFDFADKQALANIAGVPNGRFVQVNSPFVANEITDQYDPETTAVVFARSEKDKDQPPQPAQRDAQGNLPLVTRGPRKGQPVSDYLQYYAGNERNLKPMAKPDGHIYIAYLPVLQFKAGASGITSATQIRDTWPRADEATRDQIVTDLYPRNPAAAKKILNKYLGEAPLAEDAAGVGVVKNSKDPRYVMATMGDQNDVNSKTLGKMMKAYHLIGKNPANTKQRPVKGNIAESRLNEFAPDSSGDGGDDGFSEETLKRFAAQWWQGDEDPRVERTLAAAGWEIGQDEGYDDEPGVFVVQAGDVNGNSYISWPAHELKGLAEGSGTAKYKVRSIGTDSKGEYYISPSTGQKVYKSGVKVGDHEVPGTKEIKPKLGEQGVAEGISVVKSDYDLDQMILTLDIEGQRKQFTYWDYDENFDNAERKDVFAQLQEQPWYAGLDHPTKMEILDAAYKAIRGEEPSEYRPTVGDEPLDEAGPFSYGAKKPRKGSVAYNAMMKRKEQEKNKPPIEPRDQMVGTARVIKDVAEGAGRSFLERVDDFLVDYTGTQSGDAYSWTDGKKVIEVEMDPSDSGTVYWALGIAGRTGKTNWVESGSDNPKDALRVVKNFAKNPLPEGVAEGSYNKKDIVNALVHMRKTIKQIHTGQMTFPPGFASELEITLYDAINALRNNPDPGVQNTVAELSDLRAAAKQVQTGREGFPPGYASRAEWVLYDAIIQIENQQDITEDAEDLNVGDPVIITGRVNFQGKTGDIDSFGEDKRFVVVNLYNHGKHSFHSSDVSYNNYADREVDESLYQYDREDPYNSEFAPDVGMGRMTLRGWKQSMIRRVKEFAAELERSGQDLDRAAVWDHVYKKLQSLNLDPIAQEIELAHQQLEKIRRQGGIRSRAFNK